VTFLKPCFVMMHLETAEKGNPTSELRQLTPQFRNRNVYIFKSALETDMTVIIKLFLHSLKNVFDPGVFANPLPCLVRMVFIGFPVARLLVKVSSTFTQLLSMSDNCIY